MTIRRLFPFILGCLLFILAVPTTPDPDMWWHLKTGERILTVGLPRVDVFSHTVPGAPWLAHEWLVDVLMWTVYGAMGFRGLGLLFAVVIVSAFFVTYLSCDGRPYVACFVVSLAALVAFGAFGIRAQMFNLLFLSVFALRIERFKDNYSARPGSGPRTLARQLILLPVLTAIWANCHSGFMLGVGLLLLHVVGEGIQLRLGPQGESRLDWRGIRALALTAAACLVAALVNPHGVGLFTYSFETLGARYVANGWVIEWASPSFHDVTGWPCAAMLALGAAAWAFDRSRAQVTDALLFIGFGAAGLYSARHVSLFAVASAPVVCRAIVRGLSATQLHAELTGAVPEPVPSPFRRVLYWTLAAGLGVLAVVHADFAFQAFDRSIATKFPVAAVDFMEREGLTNRHVYNNYGWGGYLVWRGVPTFIDGRADVYGDEFIRKFVKAHFGREDWRVPLDEYSVECVLIVRDSRLRTLLLESGGWREAYRDGVASVLVRPTD